MEAEAPPLRPNCYNQQQAHIKLAANTELRFSSTEFCAVKQYSYLQVQLALLVVDVYFSSEVLAVQLVHEPAQGANAQHQSGSWIMNLHKACGQNGQLQSRSSFANLRAGAAHNNKTEAEGSAVPVPAKRCLQGFHFSYSQLSCLARKCADWFTRSLRCLRDSLTLCTSTGAKRERRLAPEEDHQGHKTWEDDSLVHQEPRTPCPVPGAQGTDVPVLSAQVLGRVRRAGKRLWLACLEAAPHQSGPGFHGLKRLQLLLLLLLQLRPALLAVLRAECKREREYKPA